MQPVQLLFMRGVISTIFSVLYVNSKLKYVVWDSIPRHQFKNLAIRSGQACLLILIQFTIVKHLSLIYIGVAQNITPLVTVIMSYFMTGEQISAINVLMIIITFCGVTMITYGFNQQKWDGEKPPLLATLGAFSIPFLLSLGNITMSKMKGLDENTVSLYMNPFLGLVMFFVMYFKG